MTTNTSNILNTSNTYLFDIKKKIYEELDLPDPIQLFAKQAELDEKERLLNERENELNKKQLLQDNREKLLNNKEQLLNNREQSLNEKEQILNSKYKTQNDLLNYRKEQEIKWNNQLNSMENLDTNILIKTITKFLLNSHNLNSHKLSENDIKPLIESVKSDKIQRFNIRKDNFPKTIFEYNDSQIKNKILGIIRNQINEIDTQKEQIENFAKRGILKSFVSQYFLLELAELYSIIESLNKTSTEEILEQLRQFPR